MRTLSALIVMLIFSQLSFSQNDSAYIFMIPPFKIHQNENGKKVFYEFENEWNLVTVTDSSFIADPKKYSFKSNINDISKISFHTGSNPKKVAMITAIVGFGLGFLAGGAEIKFEGSSEFHFERALIGGCLGALVFGIIGGSISAIAGKDEMYVLSDSDMKQKKQKIINILKKDRIKK